MSMVLRIAAFAAVAASFFSLVIATPAAAREVVAFNGGASPGTIVVRTNERRLYLVLGEGRALRYTVGVGRAGRQWAGRAFIDGKHIRPAWSPPPDIRRDKPGLPSVIPGGTPENPMGAAALTLSGGELRHPRHQQPELDRRLCVVRLHPHVQPGHRRSLWPGWRRNAGGGDALESRLALGFSTTSRGVRRCSGARSQR